MKNDKIKFMLSALFFVVLAAITFRCAWPADHVFAASDLNIGRLGFIKNHLPASLTGYFTGNQLLGNSGASFSLFKVMLACLPAEVFGNVFYGGFLSLGSMAMVWFLRLWDRSWIASAFGALVAFWFNSIMLAAGGHIFKIEVLVFSVLSLCLIEKSIRASSIRRLGGYSILAGICVGIMMVEQQDVALLAGLFIGSYALFRLVQEKRSQWLAWVVLMVPIGLVALLVAGGMMLDSYERNISSAASMQDPSAKWNFVTQWSMVPGEWPDLVASGWSGWGSNNPDGPYWGGIGQSAEWEKTKQGFRNFKITSVYFGIIPFLMGSFGLVFAVRQRKTKEGAMVLFWCVVGLLGFWLAFGKYSFLYKLFYQLPLVGNIRAPMKFLDNFQICLGIAAAFGLDFLLSGGRKRETVKVFWIACSSIAGLMLLAGLKHLLAPSGQIDIFTEMGFGKYAKGMVQSMQNAWFHACLLASVCAGLAFAVWRGYKVARWIGLVFVAVLAADSLLLTSHYFKASDISSIKQGNGLINYVKEHQGNERTYFVDQGGIYNQWLASDGPYHGLNLFNVWQMPRMPVEYKTFLGAVGRNQIRMWELSSVKYVAAPAGIMKQLQQNPSLGKQFKPVLNYQVPTAQGMRQDVLLEFSGAIPRFALFENWESAPIDRHCEMLASGRHLSRTKLLVDSSSGLSGCEGGSECRAVSARVGSKTAVVEVTVDAASILRFSQRHQPGWRVFVDGKPAEMLRVDYLCMGVSVPPGKHQVEFRCIDATGTAIVSLVALFGSLVCASLLLRERHRDGAE